MDIYISYVLSLLSNGIMSENALKKNLSRKFSLTDSYCDEIIEKMVQSKMIESEFDEDFQNMYSITQSGNEILTEQEDEDLNIDYKSLLGEMCDEYERKEEEIQINDKTLDNIEADNCEEDNNGEPYLKDFSQFKINVRKFNKNLKYEPKTSAYLKVKKLEFVTSILVFLMFFLLTSLSYAILKVNNFIDTSLNFKFFLFLISFIIYPIITFIIFLFQSNKKEKNSFKFDQSFKLVLLTVCIALILILSLNFLFGLDLTKWLKFLPYWLFPSIVGICAIFYPIFKNLLIKSNKFNA